MSVSKIKALVKDFASQSDYKSISIFDAKGNLLVTSKDDETRLEPVVAENIRDVIRTGRPILTDLHPAKEINYVHADSIIPLLMPDKGAYRVIGVFLARIDPTRFFFRWSNPGPSRVRQLKPFCCIAKEKKLFISINFAMAITPR